MNIINLMSPGHIRFLQPPMAKGIFGVWYSPSIIYSCYYLAMLVNSKSQILTEQTQESVSKV